MAYSFPKNHHCKKCGLDYEWDCFIDDSKAYHVSEKTINMDKPQANECVHAKLITNIDWENFNINQPIIVQIECPNPCCRTKEEEKLYFQVVFKEELQQRL